MSINLLKSTRKAFFLFIIIWYSLLVPSYYAYGIMPIVHMGQRSWPLYFFLMDAFALISAVFVILIITIDYYKRRRLSSEWIILILLLIYPLVTTYMTYVDLTTKLCNTYACKSAIPSPDLRSIYFSWEK